MKKKVCIVGVGVIGSVHLKIIQQRLDVELALCDIDKEKMSAYPEYPAYTDYSEMLKEWKPDIVHICTPHYLHTKMVIEALEKDINVLSEKPLCLNEREAEMILAAEKASKGQLGVSFQNRYLPVMSYVKEYLKDKKVLSAFGTLVWKRDKAYYAAGEWRGKKSLAGGGALINQALHTLDLLQWFVGMPESVVSSVSCLTLSDTIEVEDSLVALFSGKTPFTLFSTIGNPVNFPVEITIKTETETLRILPDCLFIDQKVVEFEKDDRVFVKECYGTGHERLFMDFYNCVDSGRAFPLNGEEGAKAVRLMSAVYKSNGKQMSIE